MRYCLWLKDCPPNVLRKMPLVIKRVEGVRDFRLASKKEQTHRRVKLPLFLPKTDSLTPPRCSYLWFLPKIADTFRCFIDAGAVVNNKAFFIPNCDLYTFSTLTSSIHMTWVRTVAGRLEMRYSYGVQVVYNTFPWSEPSDRQRKAIENTAQNIVDVRQNIPTSLLPTSTTNFPCQKIYATLTKKTTALLPPLTVLKTFWTTNAP